MSALREPLQNVSPLIRFARWSALIGGIVYGAYRYNFLSEREVGIQKHENEIRERHRIKKEAERKQNEADEMNALGKEAGVVPK